MKSVKDEFPNPVLASDRDDYIDACSFSTLFNPEDIRVTADDIVIPIKYDLVCKGLQNLIDTDEAVAVISIKSSAASFSRLFMFPSEEKTMEISIPKFGVVRRIELAGSIIAKQAISSFRCDGEFNDLYFQNATFEIRKGDILAWEESRVIYVDDTELEKPLASIFNINNGHEQEDQMLIEFGTTKIEINLCKQLYKLYTDFIEFNSGALRRYVTGIIVYPVLVEAISRISESYRREDGSEQDYRWFRAIEHKAEKKNINLSDCTDYAATANLLLGGISLDALQRLHDVFETELNSGESQVMGGVD